VTKGNNCWWKFADISEEYITSIIRAHTSTLKMEAECSSREVSELLLDFMALHPRRQY
jgi:hypothetical protein